MITFTMKVTLLDYQILTCFFLSKSNNRSHGIRKNGSLKRKNRHVLLLSDFIITLNQAGCLMALSCSITIFISSLRNLDTDT